MEQNQPDTPSSDGYELGTFHFLKAGWWVAHVILLLLVFYLGWLAGAGM